MTHKPDRISRVVLVTSVSTAMGQRLRNRVTQRELDLHVMELDHAKFCRRLKKEVHTWIFR